MALTGLVLKGLALKELALKGLVLKGLALKGLAYRGSKIRCFIFCSSLFWNHALIPSSEKGVEKYESTISRTDRLITEMICDTLFFYKNSIYKTSRLRISEI